jgi:hypothetical protein
MTVHRLANGTIDFDFYRQDAARRRSRSQRQAVRGAARAVTAFVRMALTPLRGGPSPRPALSKRFS